MSDNLFEVSAEQEKPSSPALQEQLHQPDVFANQLLDIKNANGEPKYRSVEEGLKALKHSQEYITQLTTKDTEYQERIRTLEEELAKRQSVEDAIASFSKPISPEVTEQTTPVSQGLDEASIQKLLEKTLTQREAQALSQTNTARVREALVSKYGDKASEVVTAKAKELGMSMEDISQFASRSPQAVLAWFNASTPASSGAPIRSTVNIPADVREPAGVQKPTKSLLRGASSKDREAFIDAIRKEVYRKNGIDS